ncbi:MAG: cytochrome c oxidase subunit II [Chloroflexi bacterium]|nr:cytochrome c oxidase subunit II [Chloroflexota bacterium]
MGEVLVLTLKPFPLAAAEEADIVDEAFLTLMALAVPVFAFVLSALGYTIPRFRRRGAPTEDGPPIHGHGKVIGAWLLVTTALTIVMIIFPGATGLLDLRDREQDEDLVVQVAGRQYAWIATYPEFGVTSGEIVLPLGKRVRFDVTSADVLHSFWVPAFRMKIDAVPGIVTRTYITPDRTGSFADDSGFRLQCAELCGTFHNAMRVPVRVVESNEFDAWVGKQARSP